jgi:hypothetical protein
MYNKYCTAAPSQRQGQGQDQAAIAAAAAARAAAEAAAEEKRRKDAELAQQQVEADTKRRMEDIANQAQFLHDRDSAAAGLRGADGAVSAGAGGSGLRDSTPPPEVPEVHTASSPNTETSVVDLSDTNLTDANKALARHQWNMSIDQRYKDDPQVQQYIRDLWNSAAKNDTAALGKIRTILTDQLLVSGLSRQQVDQFFATFDTFTTGNGTVPSVWNKTSTLAHQIDTAAEGGDPQRPYYHTLVNSLGKTESIKAGVVYMGSGPQTAEDCVLHAISNGAQVPFAEVRARLDPTLKNLAIARSDVRANPGLAVTSQKAGGMGGLNPFEEILIAKQVGNVIGVPDKNFAKAIESTGRPVITSVLIDEYNSQHKLVAVGGHEVAVTGVYRADDGRVYYSVMDSNLKTHPNFTAYIEKSDFEQHMIFGGGYVVVPVSKH